jgi:hypothetical protein
LVNTFPRFSQNSFEKQQAAACCFSKEFCANPKNIYQPIRKGELHFAVFKRVL